MNASAERITEIVGPIVVKEVRQGLRARVFAICFALLLLACLCVAMVAAAETRDFDAAALGSKYLAMFLAAQSLVCCFVIPYTAYRSMVREREEETWVLLALTGLSSAKIVRGKVTSALSQAALYASACAPFVVFSYYLNGVDLPMVAAALGLTACWTVMLTCLAVALGTEGETRVARAGVHFAVLGLLGGSTLIAIVFGVAFAEEGGRWWNEDGFLAFVAAFPVATLSTAWVLLEGAGAGLSLASQAATSGVRRAIWIQHGLVIAFAFLACSLSSAQKEMATVGSVITSLMLVAVGVFCISERDGFPRSERGRVSWGSPGALRGWLQVMALLAADTIAWVVLYSVLGGGDTFHRRLFALLAGPLYVGLYLSCAAALGRVLPFFRTIGQPISTRAAFILLVAVNAVFWPILAVVFGNRADQRDFNHFNPLLGMVNFLERNYTNDNEAGLLLLGLATVFWAVVALVVLKSRDRERNA